ncbi:hypothetical protein AeRB84_015999 [Aphanomyces euteiches]|nr:hypothetical protein AeRB84_015999 [Aphanomyces euteiches]
MTMAESRKCHGIVPDLQSSHESSHCKSSIQQEYMILDDLKRKRMTGIPKFLRSLYRMLEVEDPSVICWTVDGCAIQILSERRLETEILRKYFNHEKASSFQRQLNNFGFRKWTKTQSHVCTFSHPCFLRHRPELLPQVLRKSPRSASNTPKAMHLDNQENVCNNNPAVFTFDDATILLTKQHVLPLDLLRLDEPTMWTDTDQAATSSFLVLPDEKSPEAWEMPPPTDFDFAFLFDDPTTVV